MEETEIRALEDAAALRDVRAAAASMMALLDEGLHDAQSLGIHAASIQEWSLAKFGKPLSELRGREAADAVMHVNRLIYDKKALIEAREKCDAPSGDARLGGI